MAYEASLLRPTELACPPGIHARLFIKGFKALFLRMGEMELREFYAVSCVLLTAFLGGTDPFLRMVGDCCFLGTPL